MIDLISQIDDLLPQTQCGKCGYTGCLPYAQAIANGEVINKCPPGGEQTIHNLANLLKIEFVALEQEVQLPQIAFIKADECIGCTKCIAVCPTDAIIGAGKFLHIVLSDVCSGCELCLAPCPVNCIDLLVLDDPKPLSIRATLFKKRYHKHQARITRLKEQKNNKLPNKQLLKREQTTSVTADKQLQRKLIQLQTTLDKTYKKQKDSAISLTAQINALQQAIANIKQQLI